MKKFKFNLETLLKMRKIHEDLKKKELYLAIQKELNQRKTIAQLDDKKENTLKYLSQRNGMDALKLIPTQATFIRKLEKQKVIEMARLKDCIQFVKTKKKELMFASKELKVIDKFKEKKHELFLEEYNYQEQKFINEISVLRYAFLKNKEGNHE